MTIARVIGALILLAPLVWLLVAMWGQPKYPLTDTDDIARSGG